MPLKRRALLAILMLGCAVASAEVKGAGVTSIAAGPDGRLFVLLTEGRLIRFDLATLRYRQIGSAPMTSGQRVARPPDTAEELASLGFEIVEPYRGVSVAVATDHGTTKIYVTGIESKGRNAYMVHVTCLDEEGQHLWARRFLTLGPYGGTAVDPVDDVLYLSGTRSSEIFRISLQNDDDKPTRYVRPRGGVLLGAIALDLEKRRMFISDVARGAVLAMDLTADPQSKVESRVVIEGLGEPAALTWDAERSRLWIADRLGRAVIAVDPDQENGEPIRSLPWRRFGSPSALAVTASGDLWAGDAEARRLVLYPADGGRPRTFKF